MKRHVTSLLIATSAPLALAAEVRAPDPISIASVSQLLLGLLLVVGLIFFLAWVFRRANLVPGQSAGMRVVASVALGPRERAVLVQCGDKQLLLGVASGSVNLLAQFDEPVITPGVAAQGEFAQKLAQLLHQRKQS